jgi:hypothetical protein
MACDSYEFYFHKQAGENRIILIMGFGVPGVNTDTSTRPSNIHIPDTGVYHVRLKSKNNAGCADSAKTEVRV